MENDAVQDPILALDLAAVHARTGRRDEAIALLDSLPRSGLISGNRLPVDPRWDPPREDPASSARSVAASIRWRGRTQD